ncbi:LOW QUALITY PROTEIN: hypothetical protein PHMEG_00039707 [Phytophthora megakarya]|uniref:Helicase-associated domain-containing protein n=1 Tax=Phytophthora megakarya TaxID=4795 RepID=A0A225UFB1_9STRA|nr:LOW QUALITY PROTEIN: hypothetical protein PHMEG_00039707 [Phytophthora megakarya]
MHVTVTSCGPRTAHASPPYHVLRYNSTLSLVGNSSSDRINGAEKVELTAKKRSTLSEWEKKMLGGLKSYKGANGHLLIPQAFTVPFGDASWPQGLRGYRLGNAVATRRSKLRKDLVTASMLAELERMDFVWNVTQFNGIVLYFRFYKVHGHLDVPNEFVVPEDKAWPMLAWGRRLGYTVMQLRSGYREQTAKSNEVLEKMGSATMFMNAIGRRRYLSRYKHTTRSLDIVSLNATLKFRTHPMARKDIFGKSCAWHSVRNMQSSRDKASLEVIGFAWDRDAAVWNQWIIPSIQVFVEVFKHGKVPYHFCSSK